MLQKVKEMIAVMLLTLSSFFNADEFFEVRILNTTKGVVSGYFQADEIGLDAFAEQIEEYAGDYTVYFTPNSVYSDLFDRSPNRLSPYAKNLTKDSDGPFLRWLMIDVDPVRPAGVSATAQERESAEKVVAQIKEHLFEQYGLGMPFIACSGNGYNLYYYLGDLENNDKNRKLVKAMLNSCNQLFSTENAKVDLTTYNPARIFKIYGSGSFKGESTEERPHSLSFIVDIPEISDAPQMEDLEKLAAVSTAEKKNEAVAAPSGLKSLEKRSGKKFKVDLDAYLEEHDVAVRSIKEEDDGRTIFVLDECPWNADHQNHSAYAVQFPDGGATVRCHHDSCSGKGWKDFVAVYGPVESKDDSEEKKPQKEDPAKIIYRAIEPYIFDKFVDQNGETAVYVEYENMQENCRINSIAMTDFINSVVSDKFDGFVTDSTHKKITGRLGTLARRGKKRKTIMWRANKVGKAFYYDLADEQNHVIKISSTEIGFVKGKSKLFYRGNTMVPQVMPIIPSDDVTLLDYIRKHFVIIRERDRLLFCVFIVACFAPGMSRPIMVLQGEKGAAKSTALKMVKQLIDPESNDGLLSLSKEENEIVTAVSNTYLACFDNLSNIRNSISDLLCKVVTGTSIKKRTLYSNNDVTSISLWNPLMMDGMTVGMKQSDLIDRCIFIHIDRVTPKQRKTDRAVKASFDADLPVMLGLCLTTLSRALALLEDVELKELSRMADFEELGYCIAEAIGGLGAEFLKAYAENRELANEDSIMSNPLTETIVAMMAKEPSGRVQKRATDMLRKLKETATAEGIDTGGCEFPKRGNELGKKLKVMKSNLELVGIKYTPMPTKDHNQEIVFEVMNSTNYDGNTESGTTQNMGDKYIPDEPSILD